jgi:ethanolamine utilization protein EutN
VTVSDAEDVVRLARVMGQVVSTVKNSSFDGLTVLVVQDLDDTELANGELAPATGKGTVYSVVDPLGAGVDEIVLIAQGSAAIYALRPKDVPTDATVIGIVDSVTRLGVPIFRKD